MPENDASKSGDWGEYRRLLISELERFDAAINALAERIERGDAEMREHCARLVSELRAEIAVIRAKLNEIDVHASRLVGLEAECTERRKDVIRIDKDVTALTVKSGPKWIVWGALGGLVPAIGALIWWLLSRGGGG
jgi:hypothetical protein